MSSSEYNIWDILQFGDFIPLDVEIEHTVKKDLKNPCIRQFYIVISDLYKCILGLNYAKI